MTFTSMSLYNAQSADADATKLSELMKVGTITTNELHEPCSGFFLSFTYEKISLFFGL